MPANAAEKVPYQFVSGLDERAQRELYRNFEAAMAGNVDAADFTHSFLFGGM